MSVSLFPRFAPVLVLASLASCGLSSGAVPDDLSERDREFARATAERGVEGWVEFFAPEGFMFTGPDRVVGPAAIRRVMEPFLSDPTLDFTWSPESAWMDDDGELGYTIGRYERRTTRDGEVNVATGWYLTVWRRQQDGRWLVEADIGSPDR